MANNEHRMAKGTLYLMIAQVIFLGSGYVIHFVTARIVDPVEYGRFGVVLAILQIFQIFLVKGIPDAVTKYISEGRDSRQVNKISLKIQGIFSVSIFLLLIIFSPFIANILNDTKLTVYIILVSAIVPTRAVFSLFIGFFNGLREFKRVSFLFNTNTISRVFFVFLFLFLGFGILGVIGGYIFSSFLVLILCIYFLRSKSVFKGENISSKEIIIFAIPMIIFSVSYLILMNLDLLFIKAFLKDPANAGYYTAARMISSIIFVVFFGLSLSLLPSISKSVSKKEIAQIRSYIHLSLRYMMMIIVPLCIIIGLYANGILTIFYPYEYGLASASLSILVFGTALITVFVILGTILNGAGKPRISMGIGGVLVIIFTILNYLLVNRYGMIGGAWATFIVGSIGAIISGLFVYKNFKALIEYKSFLRISIGGLIIGTIGFFINVAGFLLICWAFILLGVYVVILYLLKEINKEDIALLKALLRR